MDVSFAIVGVNGGTAATTNPCLGPQLSWADRATTRADSGQPGVQLYLNTANPGEVLEEFEVSTWPTSNVDSRGGESFTSVDPARRNPYGRCTTRPDAYREFSNDLPCSWQYGWNRAMESVDHRFAPAAREAGVSDDATDYTWWLDVETMNSWQHAGPDALARNTAAVEGMKQFLTADGVTQIGLYSTGYQWSQIVGRTLMVPFGATSPAVGGNLLGVMTWLAGAADAAAAQRWCTTAVGLTGGPVVLIQYIVDGLDYNASCR